MELIIHSNQGFVYVFDPIEVFTSYFQNDLNLLVKKVNAFPYRLCRLDFFIHWAFESVNYCWEKIEVCEAGLYYLLNWSIVAHNHKSTSH
jgi:hypothetical protein